MGMRGCQKGGIQTVRRFFVEEVQVTDGQCTVIGSEARHITKVLRMKAGDRLILMDGKGDRFLGMIHSADPRKVRVEIQQTLPRPVPSPVEITLCQALLKSAAMDEVIQKSSELGAHVLMPFASKRSVVRLSSERLEKKLTRWRQIARSSAKQCDRIKPLRIDPLLPFEDMVGKWKGQPNALKVVLWEEEAKTDLKDLIRSQDPSKRVVAMVGPEGGFRHEEIRVAGEAGFLPVTLGRRILRAETAALTLVAVVQYEWGDLGR
jgi:16S rRNA (uracil1498-N3)-methyltransferase